MYGLVQFDDSNDMVGPATVLQILENNGFSILFADDILELVALAGGEVASQEQYESYKQAEEEVAQRYEKLRDKLRETYVGLGPEWEAREMIMIQRVKTSALIDMAESLAIISGVSH